MAKAGRPKKDSAGLPDWFDIEKYRQVKSYGAAEWFQQLVFRSSIQVYYESIVLRVCSQEWLALLQADPQITVERLDAAYPIGEFSKLGIKDGHKYRNSIAEEMMNELTLNAMSSYGVRPATNADIFTAHFFLPQSLRTYIGKQRKKVPKVEIEEAEEVWQEESHRSFKGNSFGRNKYRKFVRVDLSLPDALLKRNFSDYLKAQRKDALEVKSPFFKNQDFSVWYNSGVLPYMDLRLWEQETGHTFRWSAFVDALNLITDKPVGSEDACRKTAKTLADKLMDVAPPKSIV